MSLTSITSREFNQDIDRAKKAAVKGPVFITDGGHAAHVLLSIDEYHKITSTRKSIVDLLAMQDAAEIDFEPPRIPFPIRRPADFSPTPPPS